MVFLSDNSYNMYVFDVFSTHYRNMSIISSFWSVNMAPKPDVVTIADYRSLVDNIVD